MSAQYLNAFWNKCEDQLKHYTTLFNIDISSKGLNVQYKILDKTPIGVCYTLIMTYQEHTEHRADVLLISMHIPLEIISSIRELLRAIQDLIFLKIRYSLYFC